MPDVLVLCAQERDRRLIAAAGLERRHRVRWLGDDLDALDDFDPAALLREAEAVPADAVVATKDRAALLATLLARRRGLPGPTPEALLRCQHKPTSRAVQRRVAPRSTPRFALVDGRPPPFGPPWFVKPVVGRLSEGARLVADPAGLAALADPGYQDAWADVAELAGLARADAHGFLAEEPLAGEEVTLEGYVHGGRVTVIGVTDSVTYPGTGSFERFEYPSRLPPDRCAELAELAGRLLPALGFDGGFFNVELFVPESGPAGLVEVNGRLASQFAPLVQAVHGRSTYDALFELALGRDPAWRAGAGDGVAISYVLRTFRDALVASVPAPEDGLEVLVRPGLRLSEQGTNDAGSYRLAILYEAGETREEALRRCRERAAGLSFRLEPPRG
jgi:biotin carboxylase